MSELMKIISSKIVYRLLSIDANKLPKIVLIVSIIIDVISEEFSIRPPN